MAALTKAEIDGCKDGDPKKMEVPEWGGHIYIRTLGLRDWRAFQKRIAAADENIDELEALQYELAAMSICDEQGEPLYTKEDAESLSNRNGLALQRVIDTALAANGVSDDDVEDEVKNSEAPSSTDSDTDSPDTLASP